MRSASIHKCKERNNMQKLDFRTPSFKIFAHLVIYYRGLFTIIYNLFQSFMKIIFIANAHLLKWLVFAHADITQKSLNYLAVLSFHRNYKSLKTIKLSKRNTFGKCLQSDL